MDIGAILGPSGPTLGRSWANLLSSFGGSPGSIWGLGFRGGSGVDLGSIWGRRPGSRVRSAGQPVPLSARRTHRVLDRRRPSCCSPPSWRRGRGASPGGAESATAPAEVGAPVGHAAAAGERRRGDNPSSTKREREREATYGNVPLQASRQVIPSDPSELEVLQRLSNICRRVDQSSDVAGRLWLDFGRVRPTIYRFGSTVRRSGPSSGNILAVFATLGQSCET